MCRKQFPGDFDIQRQTRRLELALEDDGWRGNVETVIDQEFYGIDASKTLATMSLLMGGVSSTLEASTMGSRKASRARGSTGSRQKRVSKNEKDALNNLEYLDAFDEENEDGGDNEAFQEIGDIQAVGHASIVSEFTEGPG